MRFPPFLSRERRARLFDGCQAALVWLAVLACVVSDPAVERLALAAMAAAALAAAFAALCPMQAATTCTSIPPAPPPANGLPTTEEDENDVL